ncbi:MAG: RagB/SusD family nutrient uptake outer membrane protein [Marinoscillum sp.]
MKRYLNKYIAILSLILIAGCNDFLEVEPQATLSESQVATAENVDKLVIAAYSSMGNDHYVAPNLLWPTGNLRAGDAHKGGNGAADIFGYHVLSVFEPIIADMSSLPPDLLDLFNIRWTRDFIGISRANSALKVLNNVTLDEVPLRDQRIGEMRFLRAFFYFDAKIHWKRVPFIDEFTEDPTTVSNVDLTDQELWTKIADDLAYAAEVLPETQDQIGRINKFAAKAFLAKVKLYQAYEQSEVDHSVIEIHQDMLEEVVTLCDDVINSGQYSLNPDYAMNFLNEFEFNNEVIFAIQRSIDDGSPDGKGSWPTALNYPQDPEWGCCGFHVPTQNFVNAFKTDASGLPQFDTYNNSVYDVSTDAVDPRLDHTVSMEGKPFKYDPSFVHPGDAWARNPGTYGNNVSMKELDEPDCECRAANGPFTISSRNSTIIRYADLLLWKAEALIELNRVSEALPIINDIRARAASSAGRLSGASIYNIGQYASLGSQEEAREKLRWERRLELGLEGWRFFDLVRWGIAKETLDAYQAVEVTRTPYLIDYEFTAGKHEYMPIPQQQVISSGFLYEQNPKY